MHKIQLGNSGIERLTDELPSNGGFYKEWYVFTNRSKGYDAACKVFAPDFPEGLGYWILNVSTAHGGFEDIAKELLREMYVNRGTVLSFVPPEDILVRSWMNGFSCMHKPPTNRVRVDGPISPDKVEEHIDILMNIPVPKVDDDCHRQLEKVWSAQSLYREFQDYHGSGISC